MRNTCAMINSLGYKEWDGDVQNTCVMTMYTQFLRVCEVGWGCMKYMALCYDHVYQFLRVCESGWSDV